MSVASQGIARPRMPARARPSRLSSALFAGKVLAFQARRTAIDLASGPPRHLASAAPGLSALVAENRTPLWSDPALAEQAFQRGKVQNLRRAARALDGIVIPAGQVFSFWRQVGPASRLRGFVVGRMLQEGCMVAADGGGLCQLSNALYDVALTAGADIVERHPHSRIVPGSAATWGRDATVAWNYVDLRFRPRQTVRLSVRLTGEELVVRLLGAAPGEGEIAAGEAAPLTEDEAARSCGTCDETECFRHEHNRPTAVLAHRTAFLVDEAWPEFEAYVASVHSDADVLGLPLDGGRWKLARYRWPTTGFGRTGDAALQALLRAAAIRRAGAQGSSRRRAEIEGARRIAQALARLLTPEVSHLVVAQSLLPHLWRSGHLGGRLYSVLMTRLPMVLLQARLDAAFAAHPDRPTLADFRAPAALAADEAEALAGAERILTPHAELAHLFADRAEPLAWSLPTPAPRPSVRSRRVAFPGPTVARKGAHAVRQAALALGLEVVTLGSELEGAGFWDGVRAAPPQGDWLDGVAAVVQPAIVEEQPRRLLAALAAGTPVIASPACGLPAGPGVTLVPPDDPQALIAALSALIG